MARVEVLGGLCGASVNYGGVRGSGAGALQGVELAGYLAGVSYPAMLFAEAKYMGNDRSRAFFDEFMRGYVGERAIGDGWADSVSDDGVVVISKTAVAEVVDPCRCRRCHGVGFVRARVCPKCNASGVQLMSDRGVADRLGIPFETFRRVWRDRYWQVLAKVQSFDAEVNAAVSRGQWADLCLAV